MQNPIKKQKFALRGKNHAFFSNVMHFFFSKCHAYIGPLISSRDPNVKHIVISKKKRRKNKNRVASARQP